MKRLIILAVLLCSTCIASAQWQRMRVGGMVNDSTTLPFNTRCIAASGDLVCVGGNAMGDKPGFYRSTDGGSTWSTPHGIGMGMMEIAALVIVHDTIFAASVGNDSTSAALWTSADRGATWQRIASVYSEAASRMGDSVCAPRDMRYTDAGCTINTSQGLIVTATKEKGAWKVARTKDPSFSTVSMMDMATSTIVRGDTIERFVSIRDTAGSIFVEYTSNQTTLARRARVSTTQQGAYVVCSLLMVLNDRVVAAVRDLTDLSGPDRIYVSHIDGGMAWEPMPPISSLHYGAKAVAATLVGQHLYVVFDAMGGVWKYTLR